MPAERLFIGGVWREAGSGGTVAVTDPASGAVVGTVQDGGVADAREAIIAAADAFPSWSRLPAIERAEILFRAHDLMRADAEALARLLTLENGKPLAEARAEIASAASYFRWSAEEAKRAYGRTIPAQRADRRQITLRQAVGVVAAITPWNFPASMVNRKICPALAAGCTVILKPAIKTPLSALAIAKLLEAAGLPGGVLNIVTGSDSEALGRELTTHPLVRKVTFTGSTEVGRQLMMLASGTVKRLSLELGGHAPVIVFADADLDLASSAIIDAKARNNGQSCISPNRVYAERSVADELGRRLAGRAADLRVGPGLDDRSNVGPLIDACALAKVEAQLADAVAGGAVVLTGGHRLTGEAMDKGHFFAPTVLTGVQGDMRVMREETFGPLLPLASFDTDAEALRLANDSEYGLAAYFFTRDLSRAWRFAEGLDYGIIGINDAVPSGAQLPFGGVKQSGLGRENGVEGIDAYLETKAVSIGID